jgi:electron-transferring-flavoprotein dehydrogenase
MDRKVLNFDLLVTGAGPAGLAAAIRFRQLCQMHGRDFSVCVIEKGSEVGAHILSGAVIDPIALNELIPDWKVKGAPLNTQVTRDDFLLLTRTHRPGWR